MRSKIYQLEQTHNNIKQRLVSWRVHPPKERHTNTYTDMRKRLLAFDTS